MSSNDNELSTLVVIEFVDEGSLGVVPCSWIDGEFAYWPPYKDIGKCQKAARKMESPCSDWVKYRIKEWARSGKYFINVFS